MSIFLKVEKRCFLEFVRIEHDRKIILCWLRFWYLSLWENIIWALSTLLLCKYILMKTNFNAKSGSEYLIHPKVKLVKMTVSHWKDNKYINTSEIESLFNCELHYYFLEVRQLRVLILLVVCIMIYLHRKNIGVLCFL